MLYQEDRDTYQSESAEDQAVSGHYTLQPPRWPQNVGKMAILNLVTGAVLEAVLEEIFPRLVKRDGICSYLLVSNTHGIESGL